MLTAVLLLLLCAALAVTAFSIGFVWLLLGERGEETTAERAPSITQALMRDWEARRVWRAVSGWMTTKPLQIEDRRDLGG